MKRKTEIIIGISLITLITCYVYRKFFTNPKSDYDIIKKEADKYFTKQDYDNAIVCYRKCTYMIDDQEISKRLSLCYIKLNKYQEALDLLRSRTSNTEFIKLRSDCYKHMGMKKEFLKDLALYEAFIKDENMQGKIMEMVKEICDEETNDHINKEGLRINKDIILRGLISIEGVDEYYEEIIKDEETNLEQIKSEDGKEKETIVEQTKSEDGKEKETIVESKKAEDEKLKESNVEQMKDKETNLEESKKPEDNSNTTFKEKSTKKEKRKRRNLKSSDNKEDIKNLIRAIILYHKGKKDIAISMLDKSVYKYSILVRALFFTLENVNPPSDLPLDNEISTLYLHSKIYKEKAGSYLCSALEKAKESPMSSKDFLFVDLLIFYISKKDTSKVINIISEVSNSLTNPLLEIIGEYYLKMEDFPKLLSLLSSCKDTPGKLLLNALYLLGIRKKKEAIDILYKSLLEYPSYFKSYLYLGNILINDELEESRRLFIKSLEYCSCYEEVYIIKQSILLIEVHEYIKDNKE